MSSDNQKCRDDHNDKDDHDDGWQSSLHESPTTSGDKLSNLRRWSRNLSDQRYRELDRLNQIERNRQFLELKQQNDLFDQMSGIPSGDSGWMANAAAASKSSQDHPSDVATIKVATSKSDSHDIQVAPVDDKPANYAIDNGNAGQIAAVAAIKVDEDTQQPPEVDAKKKKTTTGESGSKQAASPMPAKLDKNLITSEQLTRFVSVCVPQNKRILCLIVRDKMSRLNRAKSYFYPTYYLFIQAIVDISEEADFALGSAGNLDEPGSNPNSAENSFSASSSISADMLFIGSPNQGETGQDPAGSGAKKPLPRNSYSDNEDYTDTEGVDDTSGPKSKEAKVSQGRDSPLVYPNMAAAVARGDSFKAKSTAAKGAVQRKLSRQDTVQLSATCEESNEEDIEDDIDEEEESDNEDGQTQQEQQSSVAKRHHQLVSDEDEHQEEPSLMMHLFDNDKNPFSGTYGVLLAGRRRKKAKTYLIGPTEFGHTRKNSICKLKSNVLGTQFNAIRLNQAEDNDRCTIASISYETNVLGFKGPRKMRVFLAKDPSKEIKHLPETFKKNPHAFIQLKNMTPSWNAESQSYVLNFHGRVTQASVKNFQLIQCDDPGDLAQRQWLASPNNPPSSAGLPPPPPPPPPQRPNDNNLASDCDPSAVDKANEQLRIQTGNKSAALNYNSSIVMQFGRISNHEFTCDVAYPLSILQAFSIALSSFDSKLACE